MAIPWVLLGCAVALIGLAHRVRHRGEYSERSSGLTDDEIHRIEESGSLDVEEDDLDLEEIERAEEDFWREGWEEPESW